MIVYKIGEVINIIKFKKITLYVDGWSSIFLGNIKANEIGIYLPSDEILLNKFNAMNWDIVTDNLIHIKFLIKYSPILSKLIDNDELESIDGGVQFMIVEPREGAEWSFINIWSQE